MANSIPGWLSALFGPVRIYVAGTLLGFRPRSSVNFVGMTITDDEANDRTNFTASAFTAPTGTGVVTVTSGAIDAASLGTTGTGNVVRATSPTVASPTVTGLLTLSGLKLTGTTTNASTGTLNNVSLGGNRIIEFTNATGPTITGFDAAGIANGDLILVVSSGATISINYDDAGSSAANRYKPGSGAGASLAAGSVMPLIYWGSRWRALATNAV